MKCEFLPWSIHSTFIALSFDRIMMIQNCLKAKPFKNEV